MAGNHGMVWTSFTCPSAEFESQPSAQVPHTSLHWPSVTLHLIWGFFVYHCSVFSAPHVKIFLFPSRVKIHLSHFLNLTFSALFTIIPVLSRTGSALLKHLRTKIFQLNARKVDSFLLPLVVEHHADERSKTHPIFSICLSQTSDTQKELLSRCEDIDMHTDSISLSPVISKKSVYSFETIFAGTFTGIIANTHFS